MKRLIVAILMIAMLGGCRTILPAERIDPNDFETIEQEPMIDWIGRSQITVDGEQFTLYEMVRKDGEPLAVTLALCTYDAPDGTHYEAGCAQTVAILHDGTFYSGIELLEQNKLSYEQLILLDYPVTMFPDWNE